LRLPNRKRPKDWEEEEEVVVVVVVVAAEEASGVGVGASQGKQEKVAT
jgi:hypothetical protein